MMKNNHLIFSSIPNYNKKRSLALSYAILNENPNSVVHLFPVHGERLSLVYTVSFRTDSKATQRNPLEVLKNLAPRVFAYPRPGESVC